MISEQLFKVYNYIYYIIGGIKDKQKQIIKWHKLVKKNDAYTITTNIIILQSYN